MWNGIFDLVVVAASADDDKLRLVMRGIEIPFGAKDSELKGWEYTIPEGMEAEIKDGKIVVREKKPELTEFEEKVKELIGSYPHATNENKGSILYEVQKAAAELLELAKKEICKGCTVGLDQYWKGREDARKEAEKSYTFQYPPYYPPCRFGGICTNPFKDCVNCPRTGGDIGIYTTSGTCKKD